MTHSATRRTRASRPSPRRSRSRNARGAAARHLAHQARDRRRLGQGEGRRRARRQGAREGAGRHGRLLPVRGLALEHRSPRAEQAVLRPEERPARRSTSSAGARTSRSPPARRIPSYAGRNLEQIAKAEGVTPVALFSRIVKDGGADVIGHTMIERGRRGLLPPALGHGRPSDGGIACDHPRGAGTFPRVLGRFVREKHLFSLEEAIRKMTSLPASRDEALRPRPDRARDEGRPRALRPGDGDRPLDLRGAAQALGGHRAGSVVNGEAVWADGKATGARPGRVLTGTGDAVDSRTSVGALDIGSDHHAGTARALSDVRRARGGVLVAAALARAVAFGRRRRAGDHRAAERRPGHQPLRRPHGGGSVRRFPGREPRLQRLGDRHGAGPELVWTASCVTGTLAVHIHLGDGTFGGALAGLHQLDANTDYQVRVRFNGDASRRDGAGATGPSADSTTASARRSSRSSCRTSRRAAPRPGTTPPEARSCCRPGARILRSRFPGPGRSSRSSARTRAATGRPIPAPWRRTARPASSAWLPRRPFRGPRPISLHGREREGSRHGPSADRSSPRAGSDVWFSSAGEAFGPGDGSAVPPTLSEASTTSSRRRHPVDGPPARLPHRARRHGFSASGQRGVRAEPRGESLRSVSSTSRSSTAPSPSSRTPAPFRPMPRTCSTSIPSEAFPAPGRRALTGIVVEPRRATSSSGRSRRSRA